MISYIQISTVSYSVILTAHTFKLKSR